MAADVFFSIDAADDGDATTSTVLADFSTDSVVELAISAAAAADMYTVFASQVNAKVINRAKNDIILPGKLILSNIVSV